MLYVEPKVSQRASASSRGGVRRKLKARNKQRATRQQRPQDPARLTAALHAWFAGDAELDRILSVWIREYLLRDLRPELNVSEAHGSTLYSPPFSKPPVRMVVV